MEMRFSLLFLALLPFLSSCSPSETHGDYCMIENDLDPQNPTKCYSLEVMKASLPDGTAWPGHGVIISVDDGPTETKVAGDLKCCYGVTYHPSGS
jgi:hypothetical protein